ncbi:MAG: SCO family protein [Pseudomonadota bacterium]
MNHPAKPSAKFRHSLNAAVLGFALVLSACAQEPIGPSADGVDLRGSTLGGDFELTANSGKRVSWSDFEGQYRMVYFGFTSCPDICPTDVQRFSQGLNQFEKANPELAGKVQPIFVTVDPERDSVEVVDEFVNAFHPRLIGLTGTIDEIEAAKSAFGASSSNQPADETGWYNVNHTAFTYLFAPDGSPLGIIPTDKQAQGVSAELERWVR